MKLCDNCLEADQPDMPVKPFEVGPEKGDQRDPWRQRIDLCAPCSEMLGEGDLDSFHERYKDSRLVDRSN